MAVSGGATRAAYWAGVVLERIEDEFGHEGLGDFGRSVRIMTGSSGGMLGAAYYVLHRAEQAPPEAASLKHTLCDENGRPLEPLGSRWVELIPHDSLRPVAKYLALKETWRLFLPRLWYDDDRGIRLERDWVLLRFPLLKLGALEREGYIPSLIFSPMMIEDGRQLLISNLDLRIPPADSRQPHPRWMGVSFGSAITFDSLGKTQQNYGFTGLEFFELFPDAPNFFVSSAVRMGASFPFVSPAVSLPTQPPHRVVDAGYYDNFGIQTASAWIYFNREWLMENTSGVVLIAIRDSASLVERFGVDDTPEPFWKGMGHGFQFFTSPIAGATRARMISSLFRNEQSLQFLSDMFTREMRSKMPDGESRHF